MRAFFVTSCLVIATATAAISGAPAPVGPVRSGQPDARPVAADPPETEPDTQIDITIVETPAGYMRFSPQALHVESGTTTRITFKNESPRDHVIFLGAQHAVAERRGRRASHPQAPFDTTDTLRIPARGSAALVWSFAGTEPVDLLCLLPGHFDAGLRGLFVVHDHDAEIAPVIPLTAARP